jgi:hypothetical protein
MDAEVLVGACFVPELHALREALKQAADRTGGWRR